MILTNEPAFDAPEQPLSYHNESTWYTAAEPVEAPEIESSAGSNYGVKPSDDYSKRDVLSVFDYDGISNLDVPSETLIKNAFGQRLHESNHPSGAETAYSKTDFFFNFLVVGAMCAGGLYFLFKVVVIPLLPLPTWPYLRFRLSAPKAPPRTPRVDPRLARARMVLGVTPEATPEEIKRAYRQLIKTYHPDAYAKSMPELQHIAHEKANELNEAYRFLKSQTNPA